MAITYIPFEELFAPAYQLTYISVNGYIDVGPNTYSVFHYYTMVERQVIFQVCKKYLPWEYTQEQEQWERTQYMYQFIIKSPPPFPYEEYPLSENIIMAITWDADLSIIQLSGSIVSITVTRTDDDLENPSVWNYTLQNIDASTNGQTLIEVRDRVVNTIWGAWLDYVARSTAIKNKKDSYENAIVTALQAKEI